MPGSIVRTGDGRVTPRHVGGRRTIVRHDRRRVMVLNGFVEEVIYDNPPEAYGQVDPRTFRLPTGSGRRLAATQRPAPRDHGGPRRQHGCSARDERVRRRRGRRDRGRAVRRRVGGRAGRDRRRGRPVRLARARSRSGTRCRAHRHRRSHARRGARSRRARHVGDGDGRTPARPGRRGRRGGCRVGARAHVRGRGVACSPAHGPITAVRESGSVKTTLQTRFATLPNSSPGRAPSR